jgi:hypothetical protein
VGNENGLVDLVNYQDDRGNIPIFQVDIGGEMISTESSYQGVLKDEEEVE